MRYRIEKIDKKHYDDMLSLLKRKFAETVDIYDFYPVVFSEDDTLKGYIDWMIKDAYGYVLYHGDEVVSFMHNIRCDTMFYNEKGIYVAEWGHYLDTGHLAGYNILLQKSFEDFLSDGYTHHSVSVLNNNKGLLNLLFESGYGSRCIDGIWKLDGKKEFDLGKYSISKSTLEDLNDIVPIIKEHDEYMNAPPTMLGFTFDPPEVKYKEWLDKENSIVWKICCDDQILGIMHNTLREADGCDSVVDDKTIGVQTTHILEKHRGKGLAKLLLYNAANYALDNGFEKLSVDYESINPSANGFWRKWFEVVVVSVTRYLGK